MGSAGEKVCLFGLNRHAHCLFVWFSSVLSIWLFRTEFGADCIRSLSC